MAIQELTRLIRPPSSPKQIGTQAEWRAVEEELGITFPSDFHAFIHTYGSGRLGDFYGIWSPYQGQKFIKKVREICGYERDSQAKFPKYFPYAIFPEHPGFLPWGGDDNGNYYGWLTDGPPDEWRVLSNGIRGEGYRLHPHSMTSYLVGVFRREIRPLVGGYPSRSDFVFSSYEYP